MGASSTHRLNVMRVQILAVCFMTLYFTGVEGVETRKDEVQQREKVDAQVSLDVQALLKVKESFLDRSGVLDSWEGNDTTPCSWNGVICGAGDINTSQPAVVSLVLRNSNLSGTISPSIGQLSHLETLHLGNNSLTGEIPFEIANLSALRFLDLSFNSLSGSLPFSLGNLRRLQEAIFDENYLIGEIPSSVQNLSSCVFFSVKGNWGLGGLIPAGLRSIPELNLQNTGLRGPLPSEFYINNLNTFLYLNNLVFPDPPDFSGLPVLRGLYMRNASLAPGPIPESLASVFSLEEIDFSDNSFVGEIPQWIATLPNLTVLRLSNNNISGSFPQQLGQISVLSTLDVSGNNLNGSLPEGLCAGGGLERLNLSRNRLDGPLTRAQLQNCSSLSVLDLGWNYFSGNLPSGLLSGAKNLSFLDLSHNWMDGSISWEELGSAESLMLLDLSNNEFSGNRLEGSLEPGLGNSLLHIQTLNLSRNLLTGEIPSDLGDLETLQILDLSRNRLSGEIPSSFGNLKSLRTLDLSYNDLSGKIGSTLLNLPELENLNLSYNMFSGSLPRSSVSWPSSSFFGNKDLCLTSCSQNSVTSDKGLSPGVLAGIIVGSVIGLGVIVGVFIALCMAVGCCKKRRIFLSRSQVERKNSNSKANPGGKPFLVPEIYKGFSYGDVMTATDNLNEKKVIGRGGYGTVYRGETPNGVIVAVKHVVLQEQQEPSSRRSSFQNYHLRDVEIAGQSRHKNIVNLIGFCQKADETFIVYEFMPNGSLGDALHRRGRRGQFEYSSQRASISTDNMEKLNWRTRLNILIGAASALEYMHNECRPQILHRDVKSNNILLDANFEARLTDFGMAKMVENVGLTIPSMAMATGSAGYLAPECFRNMKITDKSDVYSFGVVILETLTGIHPTESTAVSRMSDAQEDSSLVDLVISTLRQEGVLEAILDTALQEEVIESQVLEKQMTLVLQTGLLCTLEDPQQRPSMREVIEMLEYSKGERGKIRVPDLGDILENLNASPPLSPEHDL
ncbi:hypothetical protein R1flu_022006 [Riccia fluitans]|uniref:Protein kinase domain-containing protein n=1 Tax=Riccia fluitans TaxID=41844 RepID=A0ABD1ZQY3_9MARC